MPELDEGSTHYYGDMCPVTADDDHGADPESPDAPAVSDVDGSTGRVGTSDRAAWSDADLGDAGGDLSAILARRIAREDRVPDSVLANGSLALHHLDVAEGAGAVADDRHRCPTCRSLTAYQSYSGGREWYCPTCDTTGEYPADLPNPPRAVLLRTEEGRRELRRQMREVIAARKETDGEITDAV